MKIKRFKENPIIRPDMHKSIEKNINGPSLIKVPEWVINPLGKYYLYFADHSGKYIKLAYSDNLKGPWKIYIPGTLKISDTPCTGHIASPDVHIDNCKKRIIMYYHGTVSPDIVKKYKGKFKRENSQYSFASVSNDGINFKSNDEVLATSYLRVFKANGTFYGLSMPGLFFQSDDGITNFKPGCALFTEDMRHSAVLVLKDRLLVFYSNAYDCPEHIIVSEIPLTRDFNNWYVEKTNPLILPEYEYEGVNLPLKASERGYTPKPVRQLRDPAVYKEQGKTFILYTVKGEFGIAVAELKI